MTEEDKSKIEPRFNKALSLWHSHKIEEAINLLKQLNKEFPNQPVILGMIGAIYFSIKNWGNSLIYYEKTVLLTPKSEIASIALFHCLWNHEKFDEALKEAHRFVKANGFSKEYAYLLEELDDKNSFD